MEGKIYSPVGKFAKRAKLMQAKCIALPAILPSGLNERESTYYQWIASDSIDNI